MIVSAHVFALVTHALVPICHHRSVSPERDMRPRSRSPVSGRQLALLPGSRAMTCPCDPCPWCTLRLPHDSHIDDVKRNLRNQMLQWADNGCSVFQVALAVVSYEWILKHHEQRPYGQVQETFEIAPIPGHAVRGFAGSIQNFVENMVVWIHAPPPPPPGLQASGSSSSSASAAGTPSTSVWLGATPRGSVGRVSAQSNDWDEEIPATLPEVHPHFQWQAGSSKKVWRSFEEPWQTQLRDAYNSDQSWFRIKWEDPDTPDTYIDFVSMHQQNETTLFQRNIRIKPQ
jgi:hypothetical protein